MTERSWGRRLTTSIALAVTALAVIVLPATPAHATYGPNQSVYVQVTANDGTGQQLARLEGTVAFDDSNTKYRYALTLCWQNAYPMPSFIIVLNGSTVNYPVLTGYSSATGCQQVTVYDAEATPGITVSNLRFDVTAGWFSSVNGWQYMTRTKSSGTYDNPFN
ncbi:hypothetical protein Aph01nite_23750 [Acrocarpospora phusangensis]|uniref:PLAT domain-containing protein n=1 Tax=Acrocarpospora phusangensis TaxID=1070424 RepID=A0A919UPY5_9ACTN|nr:hypothetical protein [Acrocarpospora phusangensis]GIH24065.1 hypothetical protein Aph01nite_23750 [Acrocarpospora phusangensis]